MEFRAYPNNLSSFVILRRKKACPELAEALSEAEGEAEGVAEWVEGVVEGARDKF